LGAGVGKCDSCHPDMNMAFDECKCGHVAIEHFSSTKIDTNSSCAKCDCRKFEMKPQPELEPLDHVPN